MSKPVHLKGNHPFPLSLSKLKFESDSRFNLDKFNLVDELTLKKCDFTFSIFSPFLPSSPLQVAH